jgi:XTP/dITP diphosphohydrolase
MRSRGEVGTLREAETTVYFATRNVGKYAEAAQVAKGYGIRFKQLKLDKLEIQAVNLEEIAAYAARDAANETKRSVVVEDAGLFIDALEGFPGPYSAYVYKTIGYGGVLRLMNDKKNRSAHFQAVVAFCRPGKSPSCFSGIIDGIVGSKAKGNHGFGFDPIFMPKHGAGKTFAELTITEKNRFSHRAKAFSKFFRWFVTRRSGTLA